jgi:hypothetical protein
MAAQNKRIEINDGTSLQFIKSYKGDTVLNHLDTIIILNKATFKIYKAAYDKVKTNNSSIKELLANYENLIQLQDDMLNTKEKYYQDLKTKFDSLAGNATIFIDKSSANILQISSSLGKASDNLVETQKLLLDSQKLLEEERKNNWKRTLKVGVGGFTIGLTVGVLFFLFTK